MTDIDKRVEIEYRKQIERIPTRKKAMINFGIIGTIASGIAFALPKIYPEYFPELGNMDTLEYIQLSAAAYPTFLAVGLGIGALEPEVRKVSAWMAYKGVDYIFNRFRRSA